MREWHSIHDPDQKMTQEQLSDIVSELGDELLGELVVSRNQLVAMPLDPYWVHIYWNILSSTVQNRDLNPTQLKLKISDLGKKESYTIPIQGLRNHRSVLLPTPGGTYSLELGTETDDKHFQAILDRVHIALPAKASPPEPLNQKRRTERLKAIEANQPPEVFGIPTDNDNHSIYYDIKAVDNYIKLRLKETLPQSEWVQLFNPSWHSSSSSQ